MGPICPASPDTHERYLTLREVSKITGLSPSTLWRLDRSGCGPRVCRISAKLLRWPESSLHEWMRALAQ